MPIRNIQEYREVPDPLLNPNEWLIVNPDGTPWTLEVDEGEEASIFYARVANSIPLALSILRLRNALDLADPSNIVWEWKAQFQFPGQEFALDCFAFTEGRVDAGGLQKQPTEDGYSPVSIPLPPGTYYGSLVGPGAGGVLRAWLVGNVERTLRGG